MGDLFDDNGNISTDILDEIIDGKNAQLLRDKILKKQQLVNSAKKAYYNTSTPIITDDEYDVLETEIVSLKNELSELTGESFDDSDKYQHVGASVEDDVKNKFPKASHNIPMGSQSKCSNEKEFRNWWRLLQHKGDVLSTYKLDGSSLALYYEDGKLIQAITRGDGKIGRDITPNVIKFSGVSKNIPINGFVSVRGECILSVENWKKIDPDALNPRNLGTGIMSREDGKNCDKLNFIAFDISSDILKVNEENDKVKLLEKLGFETTPYVLFSNIDDLIIYYMKISSKRIESAVEVNGKHIWIDGLVIKLNNVDFQDKLGESSGRPKWSTALKFESPGEITRIIDVEFSVGHTGAITPVAFVKEVEIGGTKVKRVTLNNWDYIEAKDVAIGDKVKIVKGGDIIPKLVLVLERPDNRKIISKPTECPICGGNVGKDSNVDGSRGAVIKCLNDSCSAKAIGKFKRIVKKLNMLDIGDSIIEAMYKAGILNRIGDLFRIKQHKDKIAKLNVGNGVWGSKRAQKNVDEVERHKSMTLDMFLGCLGIDGLGRRRAKIIIENANGQLDTIDDWKSGKLLKLADKVGVPKLATSIQRLFNEMIDDIEDMQQVVTIEDIKKKVLTGTLAGKSFVLTGTMSKGRKEISQRIEDSGGEVHSSISKHITYLVQADPSKESAKSKKAEKLGVTLISEQELESMLE